MFFKPLHSLAVDFYCNYILELIIDEIPVNVFLCLLYRNLSLHFTGTVAQLVERPLCDPEVAGSIPGRVIPNTLKLVLAALSLGAQH